MNFKIVAFIMFCIYTVGILGHLLFGMKPLFLWLTPFNLVLTLILFLAINSIRIKDSLVLITIFSIGFLVEVIGVKTGLLFGTYQYGSTLGFKWLDVPLVIGLNWVLLNLTGHGIFHKFVKNVILKSALASLTIVLLDVLIEPVAIKLDYWSWENNVIPLQNFMMWFIVSFIIQLIINKSKLQISFKSSLLMILLQLMFFTGLNLFL